MRLLKDGFRYFSAPTTFLPNTHAWASILQSTHDLIAADLTYVLKTKLDELDANIDHWEEMEMEHSMESGEKRCWNCITKFKFPGEMDKTGAVDLFRTPLVWSRKELTLLAWKRIWSYVK